MQKLSGTSSGKSNQSCGIFYHESNKNWACNFSVFSMIFYAIYNKQPNALYYLRITSHAGPWKVSDSYKYAPGSRKTPWNICEPAIGSLGADRRRPCRIPERWRPGVGGERWGKCSGPHRRPICGLVGGERVAGRGAPRLPAAADAGAAAPVRGAAPAAHWGVEQLACEGRERTASSEDRRAAWGRVRLQRLEDCGGAPLVARWCGLGAVEGRPCASWRGDGPLIVDPCADLRPADGPQRLGNARARRRRTDRRVLRGAIRRRGVPDILGMRAGMGKGRPWRAGP
jgi:hypothetical protein